MLASWVNSEFGPPSEVLKLYLREMSSSLFDFFTISTMVHPQWLPGFPLTNPLVTREIILMFTYVASTLLVLQCAASVRQVDALFKILFELVFYLVYSLSCRVEYFADEV